MIELRRPSRAHAAAREKIRRFFGRQRLDLAVLLTATARGLRSNVASSAKISSSQSRRP
jgi:hypothetical protein